MFKNLVGFKPFFIGGKIMYPEFKVISVFVGKMTWIIDAIMDVLLKPDYLVRLYVGYDYQDIQCVESDLIVMDFSNFQEELETLGAGFVLYHVPPEQEWMFLKRGIEFLGMSFGSHEMEVAVRRAIEKEEA